ncbi:hypothetical protein Hanom_Chr07g00592171 [Helianthus anomalus]
MVKPALSPPNPSDYLSTIIYPRPTPTILHLRHTNLQPPLICYPSPTKHHLHPLTTPLNSQ